jgi:glutamyl-tRNA synthetase
MRNRPRGRYAPSPTGYLHLGNARTALVAYWHSCSQEGTFILRTEDLDSQRSKAAYVSANLDELRWLGIDWHEGPDVGGPFAPYLQSKRHAYYEAVLAQLEQQGCLYDCYLSRKELREIGSAPHGDMPHYGLAERAHNARIAALRQQAGKAPSRRLFTQLQTVTFDDLLYGRQSYAVSDFIVRRADGEWAYQLAVVADDIAMQITDVVRGADLLRSTAAQLVLYEALGQTPPRYCHVPLLLDAHGERLAKRRGDLTLTALRSAGVRPERVVGLLSYTLGLIPEPTELTVTEALHQYRAATLATASFQLTEQLLHWLCHPRQCH